MVQSIEDYSLQNISNRINLRRSQASTLYIRFPVFLRWAMHHVSIYFLGKAVFHFLHDEKRSCFREKNTIFSYFHVLFKKYHPSFSVQGVRSYFWENEISSFPIIQERLCSNAIWKDHLLRASRKRKYGFPCSENAKILFVKSSKQNFNLFAKIVLSNQTFLQAHLSVLRQIT